MSAKIKMLSKIDISKLDTKNKFLIDWVSFSTSVYSLVELKKMLGLHNLTFQCIFGCQGYKNRDYFDGINIHYGSGTQFGKKKDPNSIWVEMSGQGCRNFETYSHLTCWDLICIFATYSDTFIVNRIDVAYDVFDKSIDIRDLADRTINNHVVSRFKPKSMNCTIGCDYSGLTVDLGSPRSDIKFRCYDKARERGYDREVEEDDFSWIRWEIQLRHDRALSFCRSFLLNNVGSIFKGIVLNYFRPVVYNPNDLQNKDRWESPDWWVRFIGEVEKISLYSKADTDYNLEKCERYVYMQAGNSLRALIEIKGIEQVLSDLEECKPENVPEKYNTLVSEAKQKEILSKLKENEKKIISVANYIYLYDVFARNFKEVASDRAFCSSDLADSIQKKAVEDYNEQYQIYLSTLHSLPTELQSEYASIIDDTSFAYNKDQIFESFLKKYANQVFFADNLYIDVNGVIAEENLSNRIFSYI